MLSLYNVILRKATKVGGGRTEESSQCPVVTDGSLRDWGHLGSPLLGDYLASCLS